MDRKLRPLIHTRDAHDAQLKREAEHHLACNAALQVLTELLTALRAVGAPASFPWWLPEARLTALPVDKRMQHLAARPDVRRDVMVHLSAALPLGAYRMTPQAQAELLMQYLEAGDLSHTQLEHAFLPEYLVCYSDPRELFNQFLEAMPWDERTPEHLQLFASFLASCLNDTREFEGTRLDPVLTHLDLRELLSDETWQQLIPYEVHMAISRNRLRVERSGRLPTTRDDLEVVTLPRLVEIIPLTEFRAVLELIAERLGFADPPASPLQEVGEAEPPPESWDRQPGGAAHAAESAGAAPKA